MYRNYQTVLYLLSKSKHTPEIFSEDFDPSVLVTLANDLRELKREVVIYVGENLTNSQVENLIKTSGDRFIIKYTDPSTGLIKSLYEQVSKLSKLIEDGCKDGKENR